MAAKDGSANLPSSRAAVVLLLYFFYFIIFFFFEMYLMIESRQKKSENFRCELLKKYNPF